jgi:hypothetical protein
MGEGKVSTKAKNENKTMDAPRKMMEDTKATTKGDAEIQMEAAS